MIKLLNSLTQEGIHELQHGEEIVAPLAKRSLHYSWIAKPPREVSAADLVINGRLVAPRCCD